MLVKYFLLILALSLIIKAHSDTDGPCSLTENILQGLTSYSGEVIVNSSTGSSLFYWMFQRIGGNINKDFYPLVIWLQGGPGCSSEVGMVGERISPLFVDDSGKAFYNNLTWASSVHLLAVDFPYGVGFSYPTAWSDWVTNSVDAGEVFYQFTQKITQKYPMWIKRDVYIFGHGYSGHFIPAIASTILEYNSQIKPTDSSYINIKGIGLGDPWINGGYQAIFYDTMSLSLGMTNPKQNSIINLYENYVIGNISTSPHEAMISYQNLLNYIYTSTGYKELINLNNPNGQSFGGLNDYFSNPLVKSSLNVPENASWANCTSSVFENFTNDYFVSYSGNFTGILANMKVLIWSGQNDILYNTIGLQSVMKTFQWPGISKFLSTRRSEWYVMNQMAGYVMAYSNLTYVQVVDAGYFSPYDQPIAVRDMAFRFIFNQGWN